MKAEKIINKENAQQWVGKHFYYVGRDKRDLKIMAYAQNYLMLRIKGCAPFCLSLNECNHQIHIGNYSLTK